MRPLPRLLGALHRRVSTVEHQLPGQVDRNALQLNRQGDLILAGAFHVGECSCRLLLPPVAASLRVLKPGQRPTATSSCSRQQTLQPGHTRETTAILLQEAAPTAGMRTLARSVSGASVGTTLLRSRLNICFWKTARNRPFAVSQMSL